MSSTCTTYQGDIGGGSRDLGRSISKFLALGRTNFFPKWAFFRNFRDISSRLKPHFPQFLPPGRMTPPDITLLYLVETNRQSFNTGLEIDDIHYVKVWVRRRWPGFVIVFDCKYEFFIFLISSPRTTFCCF